MGQDLEIMLGQQHNQGFQQQIIVKPDGSYQKSDFNLAQDAQSSWVKWNLERDKLIK